MALRFFTDFDEPVSDFGRLTHGVWGGQVPTDTGDWNASYGENSTPGVRFGDSYGTFTYAHDTSNPLSGTVTILGIRMKIQAYGSTDGNGRNAPFIEWYNGPNDILRMARDNGGWRFTESDGTTQVGPVWGHLPGTTTWWTLEIKVTTGTGVSNVQARINGVEMYNENWSDLPEGVLDYMIFSGTDSIDHDQVFFDRFWVMDGTGTYNNDFIGTPRAEYNAPTGNGNSSQWTGSDGNSTDNYLLIDEDPMSMTDYIRGDTQGEIDLFTFPSTSATGIIAVAPVMLTDLTGGGFRYYRPVTRISAVNYNGTSQNVKDGGVLSFFNFIEEDPATTSAWTASGVNGAEFGIEVRDDNT